MQWRVAAAPDLDLLCDWNRQLQEDEGAEAMPETAVRERPQRWLQGPYVAIVFTEAGRDVGYALYRSSDADSQGEGGVYLRQFFVHRGQRRRGLGRRMAQLFLEEVIPADHWVLLEALESNPAGQAFWRALGFEATYTAFRLTRDAPS